MLTFGEIAFVTFLTTLVLAGSGTSTGRTLRVLQEVRFKGEHGASSYVENGFFAKAFVSETASSWISDGNKPFPHLIWIDLKENPVVPGRVSIRPAQGKLPKGNSWDLYGPTSWEFIGSNDPTCTEKSQWTILCRDLYGAPFERKTQNKYCDVDETIETSFRCLGVSVLDAPDKDTTTVMISTIRIWKKVAKEAGHPRNGDQGKKPSKGAKSSTRR